MPTLAQLDAQFLKLIDERTFRHEGVSLANADGLMFLCPKCFAANGGAQGTHRVICWFAGKVPDSLGPKPGRWTPSGTGLHDLTFVPGVPPRSVSVLLLGGCNWHGFVRNGSAD